MKKAIIFVRGNEAEEQKKACLKYASENGYNVIETTDNLRNALLKSKEYKTLIVSDVTRITRKAREYYIIVRDFEKSGINIVAVNAPKIKALK